MITEYYSYDDATDGSMTSFRTTAEQTLNFTYDALGNITRISQSTKPFYTLVAYEYDAQNQLTKETYYDGNGTATKNIKLAYYYDYDTAGNILRVEKGTVNSSGVLTKTVEQTYSYNDSDWNDLLTSVNVNGTTYNFTYDQSGNPERYFTKNGLEYVLDWKNGSQLAYSSCFDEQWQAAYYYDANGIRRQKWLDGDVTNYTTQNGKVVREETSSRYSATCILDFVYDESGRPFALYYSSNGGNSFATYYYILNLQGDVVKLVTESGAVAASYEYDAWGNILSSTGSMARTNPLRYRGYYYDVETGFYYLQSRYYDPANRRFISADSYASTGQGFLGTNMFAYCGNSPSQRSDQSGFDWLDDLCDLAKAAVSGLLHGANSALRYVGVDTAKLGSYFLDMTQDSNGVYHASFDCWQQYFGYNNMYDIAFGIGTSMETAQFDFSCNGENYILWAWKGDYINLGAGAELGIYYGGGPHWLVEKSLAMPMTISVDYNKSNIISYSQTTWWITGFNPAYQNINASDLTVTYSVNFSKSRQMYYAFLLNNLNSGWSFDRQTYTATYVFR